MIVAHLAACPYECENRGKPYMSCHPDHACICTAEAKLRELVEAAEKYLDTAEPGFGPGESGLSADECAERWEKLYAALQPFCERPGTMNRPGNIG